MFSSATASRRGSLRQAKSDSGAISYTYLETSIGILLLTSSHSGLQSILFSKNGRPAAPDSEWRALPNSLRRDHLLWRTGKAHRKSKCQPGGRSGQWIESHSHRHPLPPRDWVEWQTDRIRRWLADQRKATRAGALPVTSAVEAIFR